MVGCVFENCVRRGNVKCTFTYCSFHCLREPDRCAVYAHNSGKVQGVAQDLSSFEDHSSDFDQDGFPIQLNSRKHWIKVPHGEGGESTVYKAKWEKKIDVVVKVLKENRESKEDVWLHEMRKSDYVVQLFASFSHEENKIFVLEFCNEGNLEAAILSVAIESSEFDLLAWDMARGLRDLKKRSIIHRDLKTTNILLYRSSCSTPLRAKLADLGHAANTCQSMKDDATKEYQPEEGNINFQSDVFSLGLIFYQMYNRLAFGSCEDHFKEMKLGKKPKFFAEVDLPYCGLITCMLARKPDARPDIEEVSCILGDLYKRNGFRNKDKGCLTNDKERAREQSKRE